MIAARQVYLSPWNDGQICVLQAVQVCVYCVFVAYASQLDALLTKKIEMLTKLKGIVVRLAVVACSCIFPIDIHCFYASATVSTVPEVR